MPCRTYYYRVSNLADILDLYRSFESTHDPNHIGGLEQSARRDLGRRFRDTCDISERNHEWQVSSLWQESIQGVYGGSRGKGEAR